MTLTPLAELERLEALAEKATPGPWRPLRNGNAPLENGALVGQSFVEGLPRPFNAAWIGFKNAQTTLEWNHQTMLRDEDADLICALRSMLPSLAATARRAHELEEMMSAQLVAIEDWNCEQDGCCKPEGVHSLANEFRSKFASYKERAETAERELAALRSRLAEAEKKLALVGCRGNDPFCLHRQIPRFPSKERSDG